MKTTSKTSKENAVNHVLDMQTIRQRVLKIKSSWTEEEAERRAVEGTRRRAELERLLQDDLVSCHWDRSEQLTLVG